MKKIIVLLTLALGASSLFANAHDKNDMDSVIRNDRESILAGVKAVSLPAPGLVRLADEAMLESFIHQQVRQHIVSVDGLKVADEKMHQMFEAEKKLSDVQVADRATHQLFLEQAAF